MRKLASIQRIWDVQPIPDADKIEMAKVLGWQCVVNKGQFKPMDLAVYFEIDSFLPIRPEFEFLRATSYRNTNVMGEGFKLRTMKFRGQISQGLLLPVSSFEELKAVELGQDVTELLGVRKWEIEERATTGGNVIGTLPYDVPHTDEIRIQDFLEYKEEFGNLPYYITTKMDGCSHSISIDEDGFHVTGHNYEYKNDGSSSFYNLVNERGYKETLEDYYAQNQLKTLTVQGEFCAPGIQKNRLKLIKPEWYVFTVRINGKRIGLTQLQEFCKILHLNMVPLEETGVSFGERYPTIEDVLARAEGQYPKGGQKEGIVVRTCEPVYSKVLSGPLSFKAVSNKYLLKNED